MTEIFAIRFESNDFSEFDVSPSGTAWATSAAAALGGTLFGCRITVTGTEAQSGNMQSGSFDTFITTITESQLVFRIDTDSLSTTGGDEVGQFIDMETALNSWIEISIEHGPFLRVVVQDDNGADTTIDQSNLLSGDDSIEIRITKATTAVSNDGVVQIYVNGVNRGEATGLDMFDRYNPAFLSVSRGSLTGSPTGSFDIDEIALNQGSPVSPPALDEYTFADMPTPCDIDSDGTFLYIAAINSNTFPTLIKFSTTLDSDGTIAFQPEDGTNIGVQCSKLDSQNIWIAGEFDGTNTVEKSEDAGVSFDVKDDGTFAAMTGFTIGPNNDSTILTCDENGDYFLTIDDGVTWETVTASGTVLASLDRLDTNPDETIGGSDSSPTNEVFYSPDVMRGGQGVVLEASNTVKGVIIG